MDRWSRTHEALRTAALELFATQGYDATGTAEIAARAGVSEMTLFRHFPAKEALLLEDPFDPLMAEAVRSRPPGEPAMRALTTGIRAVWNGIDTDAAEALRARLRILAGASGLHGAIERNSAATSDALVVALVARGSSEVGARVAATAVIAGLGVALLEWAQSDEPDPAAVLAAALDALGGGVDAALR
ncbi:TetR/AcrR family transcriptional regulator [Microbacterium sp. KUDC0406]|uniref:TetR/AcrR family transcriptional regulator n=1 Tax=Microbacterium sp. KUDC0406 TaxID=2909588 RepID=UPI001F38AA1E|nr:TetR/AcrR family transcriptional regulator [Microbacterium sp. KUDC0406]UJP09154.1 TetR/AcrR family transcriptional regulator [Microbacterium sp. KUDC0406]